VDTRVQRYLKKAEECELRAAMADNRMLEATYLDLAMQWRVLAHQLQYVIRSAASRPKADKLRRG
jgi:hypothetical protein